MEYGIGIDATLGLSFAEQQTLVREAKAAGYTSAWTPSGSATRDDHEDQPGRSDPGPVGRN